MKEYLKKQRDLLDAIERKKDALKNEMTLVLEEYPFLKRFMDLKKSLDETTSSYEKNYLAYKKNEIMECDHLFVNFDMEESYGSKYYKCGCIKCGLNTFACNEEEFTPKTLEDVAIKNYLKENWYQLSRSDTFFGNNTNFYFKTYDDYVLARKKYSLLRKEKSNADESELLKEVSVGWQKIKR